MSVSTGTPIGTAVVDSYVLSVIGVELVGGHIIFTAQARDVTRRVRVGPGMLCRIHGRDGTVIAAWRLTFPDPGFWAQADPGDSMTVHLPLMFLEFVGDAAWPVLDG